MFATIYLPNFYLQAAMRHQPGLCAKPVALIEEQEKKPVIVQLNDFAEKAGIDKGMTPSQALARSLQIVIKVRARQQEKSIQKILLHYAFTLSPFVEATAPGICTVQFTKWHRHPADNQLARHGESVPPYGGATGRHTQQKVFCFYETLFICGNRGQSRSVVFPDY